MKKNFTFLLCFFALISIANAQWTKCDGPYGGYITCFDANGQNIIAASSQNDLYFWDNSKGNWTQRISPAKNVAFTGFARIGEKLFAGTFHGIVVSKDDAQTWSKIEQGDSLDNVVSCLEVSGSSIYEGLYGGVCRSTDEGVTWKMHPSIFFEKHWVLTLKIDGSNLYAGTDNGLFLSKDSGITWNALHTGLPDTAVNAIAVKGTHLFAGTDVGLYQSIDNGMSWSRCNTGKDTTIAINSVVVRGTSVLVGTNTGFILSKDTGKNWTEVHTGVFNSFSVGQISISDGYIFASTARGMFASTTNGITWFAINKGLSSCYITSVVTNGKYIYAKGASVDSYQSNNNGLSWNLIGFDVPESYITSLVSDGTDLFVTSDKGVHRSTDNGNTWKLVFVRKADVDIYLRRANATNLYATIGESGLFRSKDKGESWILINPDIPKPIAIYSLITSKTDLYISTRTGIYLSTDNGSNWIKRDSGIFSKNIYELAVSGENIYAQASGNIFRSTNKGISWILLNGDNHYFDGSPLFAIGSSLFAVAEENVRRSVYLTTNNGKTWSNVSDGMADNVYVFSLAQSGATLFAGTWGSGVWKLDLTTLSVEENDMEVKTSKSNLVCYPNPATNSLTIDRTTLQLPENAPVHYTLSTLVGGKVMEFDNSEAKFTVSLEGIARGVYSLSAETGGSRAVVMVTVAE